MPVTLAVGAASQSSGSQQSLATPRGQKGIAALTASPMGRHCWRMLRLPRWGQCLQAASGDKLASLEGCEQSVPRGLAHERRCVPNYHEPSTSPCQQHVEPGSICQEAGAALPS